jgi:hypothetical protein
MTNPVNVRGQRTRRLILLCCCRLLLLKVLVTLTNRDLLLCEVLLTLQERPQGDAQGCYGPERCD